MSQLDHSTLALFWLISSLILAPLSVCGIFAISEFLHQRRAPRKDLRYLQRTVRHCRRTMGSDHAGQPADREPVAF
jgi:hypothetical protein